MAGKIQNEDIKSAAELVSAGGTAAQLPNDIKIYITALSLNKSLYQAIVDGDIGGGGTLVPTGTRGSPNNITTSGITFVAATGKRQIWFVATSSGEVTVTANPQISAGTTVGSELWLVGTSNDNYPTFNDGTGLALKGACSITLNVILKLFWDGSNWVESGR